MSGYVFRGYPIDYHTQIPNEFLDFQMQELSVEELRCMLYVFRRTIGFRKMQDRIAVSQFVSGICRRTGQPLDRGAGVTKRGVARGLDGLVKCKYIFVDIRCRCGYVVQDDDFVTEHRQRLNTPYTVRVVPRICPECAQSLYGREQQWVGLVTTELFDNIDLDSLPAVSTENLAGDFEPPDIKEQPKSVNCPDCGMVLACINSDKDEFLCARCYETHILPGRGALVKKNSADSQQMFEKLFGEKDPPARVTETSIREATLSASQGYRERIANEEYLRWGKLYKGRGRAGVTWEEIQRVGFAITSLTGLVPDESDKAEITWWLNDCAKLYRMCKGNVNLIEQTITGMKLAGLSVVAPSSLVNKLRERVGQEALVNTEV